MMIFANSDDWHAEIITTLDYLMFRKCQFVGFTLNMLRAQAPSTEEALQVVERLERLAVVEAVEVSVVRSRAGRLMVSEDGLAGIVERRSGWIIVPDAEDMGWNVIAQLWRFEKQKVR